MRSGVTILAGLATGILVAIGILAAFVFVGPDPVGLRPTPTPALLASASPSVATASPAPSRSASSLPSESASSAPSSSAAAGTSGVTPSGSAVSQSGFHVGQPAPALVVKQLGGGTIDLTKLKGKAVWLNFMQTTCAECVDEFPLMSGFKARYESDGLVVIAVDIREDAGKVAAFAERLKATFPIGLDLDGAAQRAWGTYALPIHFWIDTDGIIRQEALGGIDADMMAAALAKILPGVTVTP
jgi:cytochrome c biogenesis protein CcmG/thiol:disulfide interchange protein DsbE